MELQERLKRGLEHARWFTDKLLKEIGQTGEWGRRPVPGANHALWITGHLGMATNAFVGYVDPNSKLSRDDLVRRFGKGTVSVDDLESYPSPQELTSFLTERGEKLLDLLGRCTADDLGREVPEGPPFMYDVGAVFQMAAWHESLHAGQLTVIHRLVGLSPIADR